MSGRVPAKGSSKAVTMSNASTIGAPVAARIAIVHSFGVLSTLCRLTSTSFATTCLHGRNVKQPCALASGRGNTAIFELDGSTQTLFKVIIAQETSNISTPFVSTMSTLDMIRTLGDQLAEFPQTHVPHRHCAAQFELRVGHVTCFITQAFIGCGGLARRKVLIILYSKNTATNDIDGFSLVRKVFRRLETNCLILILEDGQIQLVQADLSKSE